jgi:hypothetical protein
VAGSVGGQGRASIVGRRYPSIRLGFRLQENQMARLICIDDEVPSETIALLRAASERRNVAFEIIEAAGFDYLPERRLMRS